ncbi:TPA: hypothetical protein ACGD7G_002592 [Serratia marcescens]
MRKYCEEQQISISELVKLAADIVTAAENSVSHLGLPPDNVTLVLEIASNAAQAKMQHCIYRN